LVVMLVSPSERFRDGALRMSNRLSTSVGQRDLVEQDFGSGLEIRLGFHVRSLRPAFEQAACRSALDIESERKTGRNLLQEKGF